MSALRSTQIEMSGGMRETEVSELAVIPAGVPSGVFAVTTATPVA
jgi:hypothetical protein